MKTKILTITKRPDMKNKEQAKKDGNLDETDSMDDLHQQFNETQKIQQLYASVPLETKIQNVENIKIYNFERVFGIDPQDYDIYRKLDKIDASGNKIAQKENGFNQEDYNYNDFDQEKYVETVGDKLDN